MKLSSFHHFFSSHARKLRQNPPHFVLPENALFWMVLVLLSMGAITSLYNKIILKNTMVHSQNVNHSSQQLLSDSRNHKSGDRELPIYCVKTDKPQIALSFDAAWGNEDTRQIIETLSKHQVKVTFFMTGGWVEKYPEDVKYIVSQGHELGNHSERHKNMSQLTNEEIQSELRQVHDKVKTLTGVDMTVFRPPYGDYDNEVVTQALKMGYYPIQWDIDSLDWKDYGTDSIIDMVVNNKHLGSGSIILMHNGAKYTPAALDSLITRLEEKGYEFVTVSQLILKDNYHLDQEGRQIPD